MDIFDTGHRLPIVECGGHTAALVSNRQSGGVPPHSRSPNDRCYRRNVAPPNVTITVVR